MSKDNGHLNEIGGMLAIVIVVWFVGKLLLKILEAIVHFIGQLLGGLVLLGAFYVLPFVVVSAVVGFLWFWGCRYVGRLSGKQKRESEYRWLLLWIPLTAALVFAAVGAPESPVARVVTMNVKGKVQSTVVQPIQEWPEVAQDFERLRQSVGFEKSKPEPGEIPHPYDRVDVAWTLWLAVLFGAPGIFFWMSATREREWEAEYLETAKRPLERKINELKEQVASANRQQNLAYNQVQEQEKEIARLKARDEFLSKKGQEPSEITGLKVTPPAKKEEKGQDGVLNSDVL